MGYKRITGVLLALLVAAGLLISPDAIIKRLGAFLGSPYFPVLLVFLYLVRAPIALPVTALAVLVGFKYGLLIGFPVALAGSVMSTYVPYAITRYTDFESGLLRQAEDVADGFFEATGGLRGVITARIAPVPAQTTSVAAGAAPVPTRTYLLGTAIGEIPWVFAAVTIGTSLHRLTVSDMSFSPWLIAGTVLATVVLLAGPAYKFLKREDGDGRSWRSGDDEDEGNPLTDIVDR
jgi:uncharacterized membrane protein YdjX (TVP38/TMEM64 family)